MPYIPAALPDLIASCLTSAFARSSSWRINVEKSLEMEPTSSPTEAPDGSCTAASAPGDVRPGAAGPLLCDIWHRSLKSCGEAELAHIPAPGPRNRPGHPAGCAGPPRSADVKSPVPSGVPCPGAG